MTFQTLIQAMTPGEWFTRNWGVRVRLPAGEIKLADVTVTLPVPHRYPQFKDRAGSANAAGIVACVRLGRILASPEIEEELARVIHVARHPREKPLTWDDGFALDESWKKAYRKQARAIITLLTDKATETTS